MDSQWKVLGDLLRIDLIFLWVWCSLRAFLAIHWRSLSEIVHSVDWHLDDSFQNYSGEEKNGSHEIFSYFFFEEDTRHLPSRYAIAGHTAAFAIILIAKFTAARSCGWCWCGWRGIRIIWRRMVRRVWMIVMMCRCGRQIKRIQVWICIPGFRVKSYFSFRFRFCFCFFFFVCVIHYEDSVYTMCSTTKKAPQKK